MPKPSIDGSKPDFRNHSSDDDSRRLTRDLSNLQHEIRMDFEQRISDLSSLMGKFKTLMISDIRVLNAANDPRSQESQDNIPLLTKKIDDATLATSQVISDTDNTHTMDDTPLDKLEPKKPVVKSRVTIPETARFEAGLYQLNCQLYRFRLELDQELEYRDEPLHEHFNNESELANVLQKITEKKLQEKNAGS